MKKIFLFTLFSLLFVDIYSDQKSDKNIYALISYGLGDNPENAKRGYVGLAPYGIGGNMYAPTFNPDSLYSSIFNIQSYVQQLNFVYKNNLINKSFVAIGHSRGAEMLIHFIGVHNPVHLQALILIACPVSVGTIVKAKCFLGNPKKVPNKTLQSLKKIKNKKLPIILLHQIHDTLVPVVHTQCLYQAFKSQGFKNVSVVYMKSGGHNDILDDVAYQKLQQFYKNNNLPYDSLKL